MKLNLTFQISTSHTKPMIKKTLILSFICLLAFSTSNAQSTRKLKQREALLKKQIEETKGLLKQTKKSQDATLAELTILNKQINYREALTSNLNRQIKQIEQNIADNTTEISNLEKELVKLKTEFKEMIRFAYKQRNKDYNLMYLLASKDMNEAYKRMKYINQYAENRKLQAKEVVNTQEKLTQQNEELKRNKEEKLLVIDEAKKAKEEFLADKERQQAALNEIKNNQASLQQKLNKQQAEKDKITQAIQAALKKELQAKAEAEAKAKREAEAASKNNTNTNTTTKPKTEFTETPEEKLAGKKFIENKGSLPWPVEKGTITSNFGKQQHSVVSTAYIENNGIDISTDKQATVRAVFDGKVTSVLSIPGSGKAVIITHGEYRTVYANLQDVSVETGQFVKIKTKVGTLLPDASGTISQSHFEIWRVNGNDMRPVNPASWLIRR